MMKGYGSTNPQQVFDIETYRQLMVKAGFHIEDCTTSIMSLYMVIKRN